jgi:CHAT domain-containing protein
MRVAAGLTVVLLSAAATGGTPDGGPRAGGSRGQDRLQRLLRDGERLAAAGVYADARKSLDAALALARTQDDRGAQATALNLLANVAAWQGGWPEAFDLHEQALALVRELDDGRLESRILADSGLAYWRRAEYAEAGERCAQALALAEGIPDLIGQGHALGCLGRISFKQGLYEEAVERYEQARARQEAANDLRGQGITQEDLGMAFLDRYAFQTALPHLERAATLLEQAGAASDRVRVLGNIGLLYLFQGAESEALRHFRDSLRAATQAGDDGGRGSALSKLGSLYARRGQFERALEHFQASLEVRRRIGDRREQAWTLYRIGLVYARQGRHQRALPLYEQALAIWEEIRDRRGAAGCWLDIGRAHEALGDLPRAVEFYERALERQEEIQYPYVSATLGSLGRVHARAGRREAALDYGRRAVERADHGNNREQRWSARYDLGRIEVSLGLRPEALATLREALAILEEHRSDVLPTDEARAGWLDDRQGIYLDAVALLWDLNAHAEALELAERARARALLDLLGERGRGSAGPAAPPDLASLRDQARLHGSTLLEYFLGRDRVFIWVITPQGEIHAAVASVPASELAALVDQARRGLRADTGAQEWDEAERSADDALLGRPATHAPARARGNPRPPLRRLHQALIEPVQEWLPRDPEVPVTIVPHGKLFLLSFAALPDAGGRYLVERHPIHYSPAIGVLRHVEAREHHAAVPRVMLVGNPSMPAPREGRPLPALPGAAREARAIGRLFPSDQVTLLLGPRADEARVRELAPRQAILHLATHGVVRDDAPLESLLVLAPSGARDAAGDGFWTVREVLAERLDADLVTLSACNTGLGRVSGDGVFGLGRAFLAAGASSLVVSLWRVADVVAGDQMERFYRELRREGRGKAAALRRAQIETIRSLRAGRVRTPSGKVLKEDPAYWAPFILVGSGR